MAGNFHEPYQEEAPELPSDRSAGLVLAGLAGLLAVLHRQDAHWLAGGTALAAPAADLELLQSVSPLVALWSALMR